MIESVSSGVPFTYRTMRTVTVQVEPLEPAAQTGSTDGEETEEGTHPYAQYGLPAEVWDAFEKVAAGLTWEQRSVAEMLLFCLPVNPIDMEAGVITHYEGNVLGNMDWQELIDNQVKPVIDATDDPANIRDRLDSIDFSRKMDGEPLLTELEKAAITEKIIRNTSALLNAMDTLAALLEEGVEPYASLDVTG